MAVAAETAIQAWINARHDLTGRGKPLANGAYLYGQPIRSPAAGGYCLLIREPGTQSNVVAEDSDPSIARVTAHCYAGTIQAASKAAVALANAWQDLNGAPEPCGATGIRVLVADNYTEPGYVPMPGAGGELHMFTVSADFMLTTS